MVDNDHNLILLFPSLDKYEDNSNNYTAMCKHLNPPLQYRLDSPN